jgi:hypothetical protein
MAGGERVGAKWEEGAWRVAVPSTSEDHTQAARSARSAAAGAHLGGEVALLLEDIRLGTPLPYEKLAEGSDAEGEPLASGGDGACVDTCFGDGEGVDLPPREGWEMRGDGRR